MKSNKSERFGVWSLVLRVVPMTILFALFCCWILLTVHGGGLLNDSVAFIGNLWITTWCVCLFFLAMVQYLKSRSAT